MKKLLRMLIFSAIAIYTTSLWNKGFLLNLDWSSFLRAILVISLIFYFIFPLTKIILLPLNLLTLGLVSTIVCFLLFYLIVGRYEIITLKSWVFPGMSLAGLTIPKMNISYLVNIILASLSISFIINSLEKTL